MSVQRQKKIWMLGTSPAGKGGIASVIQQYAEAGVFDGGAVHFEATHHDRGLIGRFLPFLLCAVRLWPAILMGQVAVLHMHTSYGGSFWRKLLLALPAFAVKVPVIVHLHAGSFMEYYSNGSAWRRQCMRRLFRNAFRVVVLSNDWQNWVYSVEANAKVAVIPNSLTSLTGKGGVNAFRSNPTVLYLGRVADSKGTFDLLKAFANVQSQVPAAQLVIGGDGDIARLNSEIRLLKLDGSVEFVGWADTATKSRLLSECWVYALPSYKEGLPMGILEAMAFARAVVTCPVGGIGLAVEDGVTGFLITPGDISALTAHLVKLLSAPEQATAMGNAGRIAFDQKFSHEANLPKLLALYRAAGADHLPVLRNQPETLAS